MKLVTILFAVVLPVTVIAQNGQAPTSTRLKNVVAKRAYHDQLPKHPLPRTLSPDQFRSDKTALVAYWVAGKIEDILYQVPCYCPCDKEEGHESLLDCFVGTHGKSCSTCQKEAIFCYLQYKKGRSAAQIREALARGKYSQLNLNKYVKRFDSKEQPK